MSTVVQQAIQTIQYREISDDEDISPAEFEQQLTQDMDQLPDIVG